MSSEALQMEARDGRGSSFSNKIRKAGKVPVVLYGHGKGTLSLSCLARELDAVLRHGSATLDLKGAVDEKALLQIVQWDALGTTPCMWT